jgi:broad specificity phosphatase PhoE
MSDSNLKVVIWRHGQTDWNIENRFQGHSDIPLNKVGEYQAKEAAKVLAGMKPDRIIASDLMRAKATAQALADLVDLKVGITSKRSSVNVFDMDLEIVKERLIEEGFLKKDENYKQKEDDEEEGISLDEMYDL